MLHPLVYNCQFFHAWAQTGRFDERKQNLRQSERTEIGLIRRRGSGLYRLALFVDRITSRTSLLSERPIERHG
jgi:hypothetical protein